MLTLTRALVGAAAALFVCPAFAQPAPGWPTPAPPVPQPQPMQPAPQPQPGPMFQEPPPGTPQIIQVAPGAALPPATGPRIIYVQQAPSGAPPSQALGRPTHLPYTPGDVIPPGYAPRDQPEQGLFIGGLTTFLVGYVPSFVYGVVAGSDSTQTGALTMLVPLAGPFISMATLQSSGAGTYGLAIDGIAQIAGAACFFASFGVRGHYLLQVGDAGLTFGVGPTGGSVRVRF